MNKNDAPELKPCPFCGGKAKLDGSPEEVHYWILCPLCGAQGPDVHTQPHATRLWNTRADLTASDAAQWLKEFPKVDGYYWVRGYELGDAVFHCEEGVMWRAGEAKVFMPDDLTRCEFLGPINPNVDAVRQARQETWDLVISKLRERAEDWRLQAERWQKQAGNETNEAIRNLSFSDRDSCLSKMSALKTFAIEATVLRAEKEKDAEDSTV